MNINYFIDKATNGTLTVRVEEADFRMVATVRHNHRGLEVLRRAFVGNEDYTNSVHIKGVRYSVSDVLLLIAAEMAPMDKTTLTQALG